MDTQTPNNSMPALSDKLDAYVKYWSIFAPQALLVLQDEVSDSFGVIKLANGYVQRKQRSAATGWVIGKCMDPDKRDELLDEIEIGTHVKWSSGSGLNAELDCPEGQRVQIVHTQNILAVGKKD